MPRSRIPILSTNKCVENDSRFVSASSSAPGDACTYSPVAPGCRSPSQTLWEQIVGFKIGFARAHILSKQLLEQASRNTGENDEVSIFLGLRQWLWGYCPGYGWVEVDSMPSFPWEILRGKTLVLSCTKWPWPREFSPQVIYCQLTQTFNHWFGWLQKNKPWTIKQALK